jgi:phosphatidylglycerophosphatase C
MLHRRGRGKAQAAAPLLQAKFGPVVRGWLASRPGFAICGKALAGVLVACTAPAARYRYRYCMNASTNASMNVSIYDMDRTITRSGTWTPWLVFWARREAPWRLLLAPLLGVALIGYALGWIGRARLKEIGHRLLMGRHIPRARLLAAADAYAARVVAANVFPAAVAQIAADRADGRRLVLATASNEYYVRSIAGRLGIDDVIATASRWEDDRLHHRLGGDNCYGAAKRRLIEAWLARERLLAGHLRFYSDHISDLPVFELAEATGGEAVATNPSPALRALAVRRGWRIVDWGTQGRSLFERA